MPNKPNDISSLNNECCHAPHTAQCWILDRLEVWVLETRCQAAGAVSRCRVRDNDVLMSLSVSSTQAPLRPGRGLAGRPRITHRGCCCSDGDGGHWVTCDSHEAAVTEVTQQLVCHTQQPAHN